MGFLVNFGCVHKFTDCWFGNMPGSRWHSTYVEVVMEGYISRFSHGHFQGVGMIQISQARTTRLGFTNETTPNNQKVAFRNNMKADLRSNFTCRHHLQTSFQSAVRINGHNGTSHATLNRITITLIFNDTRIRYFVPLRIVFKLSETSTFHTLRDRNQDASVAACPFCTGLSSNGDLDFDTSIDVDNDLLDNLGRGVKATKIVSKFAIQPIPQSPLRTGDREKISSEDIVRTR